MRSTSTICVSVLTFFSLSSFALDVVKDGKAVSEIVVTEDSHEGIKRAAEDLQYFIEKMSGAKLDIVNAPTKKYPNKLYVGENQFTRTLGYKSPKFNNSGYDVLVKKDYVVLSGPNTFFPGDKFDTRTKAGIEAYHKYMGDTYGAHCFNAGNGGYNPKLKIDANDDIGAWYAVSAVLENLGIRFYAPYEDGTIIPRLKDITLPEGRVTKEAAYGRREWCYYGARRSDREGIEWLKRMKCGVRTGIIYNHTSYNLISHPSMLKKHPNWFAEETPGKLYEGSFGQKVPRFTDPEFQQACVNWARKTLDSYPTLGAITLGAPDGGNPWDWRDRKKYEKTGMNSKQGYADMMWDFHCAIARELKKSHPEKLLLWWCQYNDSTPTNIDPKNAPDNICLPPTYCDPSSTYAVDATYSGFTKRFLDRRAKIGPRAKGPKWEWWLWYAKPTYPRYPVFFTKALQRARRDYRNVCDGFFMEFPPEATARGLKYSPKTAVMGEIPISHLMMYVNNKLMWNPDLNLDALLNEYYKLWFGPAEAEMKAFYEFAEAVWCRQESRSVTENSGFLKEKDVPKYFDLLAAAKAKTEPGTVFYKRIAAMEEGYASLKKLFPSLKRQGPWLRAYPLPNDTALDGNLAKYKYGWTDMKDNHTGESVTRNATQAVASLTFDRKKLFVAVRCYETSMNKLVRKTKQNDDAGIFEDDVVEVYLDTPEKSYFKIVVNPNGAVWDESTDISIINRDSLPVLWSPGTKAVVKTYPDRWEVELMIPTADFGKLGPTKQYPWGVQIGRTHISSLGFNKQKGYSIAPTGGAYRIQSKWARLWMR